MNGCHNHKPYADKVLMQDGWIVKEMEFHIERVPRMVWVKNAMSKSCNYRHTELGRQDKDCIGCKWRYE